jgi:hypothetical protein
MYSIMSHMGSSNKQHISNLIIGAAILNTLILTPFFNKDAMIIPKLMIMFTLAMFLVPIIYLNRRTVLNNKLLKIFTFLNIILLIQSFIILVISSAPIEQQVFGRTGRGLGLITVIALSVSTLVFAILVDKNSSKKLLLGLIISGFVSSLYSVCQSFGIDLLKWDSRTNGVIGTLGNPNFQSAFAAMMIVPSFLYWLQKRNKIYLSFLLPIVFIYTIYRTQSTQGILAAFFSILITLIIYTWYENKKFFVFTSVSALLGGFFAVAGMLNSGPLSDFLYKVSIQSRGDFWRSAFTTANANPFFGVGLDSFGDYSLKYRDLTAANHSFAEYTDNAHNFFLEQAATGGYIFAIINSLVVLFVLFSFFKIQKNDKKFDPIVVSLFASWIAFQMTSVVSPGSLVSMFWNALISGGIIGLAASVSSVSLETSQERSIRYKMLPSVVLAVLGFTSLLPLFNTDRIQLLGMQKGDANLVIKSTTSFPESTVRYSLIGQELFKSGLNVQALEVARSGVDFNPNSASLWALILVNPSASLEERNNAKSKILELDPLNQDIRNFAP